MWGESSRPQPADGTNLFAKRPQYLPVVVFAGLAFFLALCNHYVRSRPISLKNSMDFRPSARFGLLGAGSSVICPAP
jgi:hypothetical protein